MGKSAKSEGQESEGLSRGRITVVLLGTIVALLYVFFRVLGAFWLQNSTNADYTVVVLMAKHMAEGTGLPLFFYGQSYMGSLEPMVSALLCRMMGFSGFTVCMGTVLFSVLLAPFLYLFARMCAGWKAGVAAVLFCAVGPTPFFHYSASPRGGYSALLFFTVVILWAASEIISRERRGRAVSPWLFLAAGLLSGIAFWVNPLITPALMASGVAVLVFARRQSVAKKVGYAGVPGFVLGLLPFFVWNMRNAWRSLKVIGNASPPGDFMQGLSQFLFRGFDLLDLGSMHAVFRILIAASVIASLVFFIWRTISLLRQDEQGVRVISSVTLLLYVLIFVVAYAFSDFAFVRTPRYLLPLVPVIGVVLGVGVASLHGRIKWLGWAVLIIFCALQISCLGVLRGRGIEYERAVERASQLSAYLAEHEIDDLYGEASDQYINHFLDERVLVCNIDHERYRPYLQRMETSASPAVLNARRDILEFVRDIRGDADKSEVAGYRIVSAVRNPEGAGRGLGSSGVLSVLSPTGKDVGGALFDRTMLTEWRGSESASAPACALVVTLKKPEAVTGLRFLCRRENYPLAWSLEGRVTRDDDWTLLVNDAKVTPFFWSGERFYARGSFFRAEASCAPMNCSELRIRFSGLRGGTIRISELDVRIQDQKTREVADASQLAIWLERNGAGRVYADRWESNILGQHCDAEIVKDRILQGPAGADGIEVHLSRDTMFVVRESDATWTRQVLRKCFIGMTEARVGPWVIFLFGEGQWRDEYASFKGLTWRGFGAISESAKHRALFIEQLGVAAYERGDRGQGCALLESALAEYPNHRGAVLKLARWLREEGRGVEATVWQERYERMWDPDLSASVDFGRRAALQGVSLSRSVVSPGEEVAIKYFWSVKPNRRAGDLVVFAHFRRGKDILFQDDRWFLEDESLEYQPFDEVFVESRTVRVPYGTHAGPCELWVGVYDAALRSVRLPVKTSLRQDSRAALLPAALEIAPGK